jgi:peptide/nickel transport system permease protein
VGRPPAERLLPGRVHRMRLRSVSLVRDPRAGFGAAILATAVLVAVLAPLLAADPSVQRDIVATRFLAPFSSDLHGSFHLLGTDRFGRDVWARLAFGARVSLGVGFLAVALSVAIGVAVGAAAGFWPRRLGVVLLAVTDFALALPRVVLLLLLASLWEPSAALVIVVLGVTGWMTIARLVHGEVRALAVRPFVESAVALGVKGPRVLVRHILPNALTPVIVAAALGIGNAIMLEAGLSFLGLGVQPPTPSWGNLIASGRDTLVNAPWVATAPGVALVLVVVGATLLGDALRDRLDPEGRR